MSKTRSVTAQRSKSRKMRTTSDAIEIIDKLLVGKDEKMRRLIDEATVNCLVAQLIYDAPANVFVIFFHRLAAKALAFR